VREEGENAIYVANSCFYLFLLKQLTLRDERPPLSSSPGAATTASKRWIPPSSLKRDALSPDERHHGKFRRVRG